MYKNDSINGMKLQYKGNSDKLAVIVELSQLELF